MSGVIKTFIYSKAERSLSYSIMVKCFIFHLASHLMRSAGIGHTSFVFRILKFTMLMVFANQYCLFLTNHSTDRMRKYLTTQNLIIDINTKNCRVLGEHLNLFFLRSSSNYWLLFQNYSLSGLRQHTTYNISLAARNLEGVGPADSVMLKTEDGGEILI